MKRFTAIGLLICLLFTLCACNARQSSLVGTWSRTSNGTRMRDSMPYFHYEYYKFAANGTVESSGYFKYDDGTNEKMSISYGKYEIMTGIIKIEWETGSVTNLNMEGSENTITALVDNADQAYKKE